MLLGGVAAAALGFMIAAHIWLPILADLPLLARGSLDYEFFLGRSPLELRSLITLVSPEALGTPRLGIFKFRLWEDGLYFGWIPLGLALLAVATGWRKPAIRWIAGAALASVLLAFDTPLLRGMFDWFPGYSLFRIPSRILFITACAVFALAGHGADWLDTRLRAHSAKIALVVATTFIAFMVGEGFIRAQQYLEMRPHEDLYQQPPVVAALASEPKPYRVAQVGGRPPNFASAAAGLEFVDGYDPYSFDHYRRYLKMVGQVQRPSPYSQVYIMNIWRQPLWLYERSDPIERAYLVEHVHPVTDSKQAFSMITKISLNRGATVETKSGEGLLNEASPDDDLNVVETRPGRVVLRSRTAGTRFAVVSEVWHPGWRAFIDESPTPLHRTNGALLGLSIPPGDHEISLRFTPSHWHLGLGLGAAGVAIIILSLLRGIHRRNGITTRSFSK